ncbi:MAG: immunity 17 family protein [Phocaeicola sp.]
MKMHYLLQAIFATMGGVSLLASLLNWEWFFTAQNMQFITSRVGRGGARIIYALLGVALIALAIYFFTEVQKVVQ